MASGAWYEVTGPAGIPFVVGKMELESYRGRGYTFRLLSAVGTPQPLKSDSLDHVNAVAEVIDGQENWAELHSDDKEFSILSARRVIDAFHVLSKE
jgi:hypothetical protein